MRIWLIIIALLSFAAAQNTQPADTVLQRVAKVDRFAFGGTGYSGANLLRRKRLQNHSGSHFRCSGFREAVFRRQLAGEVLRTRGNSQI
jgi:hypothetical protein